MNLTGCNKRFISASIIPRRTYKGNTHARFHNMVRLQRFILCQRHISTDRPAKHFLLLANIQTLVSPLRFHSLRLYVMRYDVNSASLLTNRPEPSSVPCAPAPCSEFAARKRRRRAGTKTHLLPSRPLFLFSYFTQRGHRRKLTQGVKADPPRAPLDVLLCIQ